MKAVELLKLGAELLKTMSKVDLRTSDYRYIDMCEEYANLRKEGCKVEAIYYILSEKYGVSESTVKRAIRRCLREVKI